MPPKDVRILRFFGRVFYFPKLITQDFQDLTFKIPCFNRKLLLSCSCRYANNQATAAAAAAGAHQSARMQGC